MASASLGLLSIFLSLFLYVCCVCLCIFLYVSLYLSLCVCPSDTLNVWLCVRVWASPCVLHLRDYFSPFLSSCASVSVHLSVSVSVHLSLPLSVS